MQHAAAERASSSLPRNRDVLIMETALQVAPPSSVATRPVALYCMRGVILRCQLKMLWTRLNKLAAMDVSRQERLIKLGAARSNVPSAWRLVDVALDGNSGALSFSLNRNKLRDACRGEGRYLLRTSLDRKRLGAALAIRHSARRGGGGVQDP